MDRTSELWRAAIGHEVDRQIASQEDQLMEDVMQGLDGTESLEETCAKIVRNGILISIKLAADMVLGILVEAGLGEPKSDDELRRQIMNVVK